MDTLLIPSSDSQVLDKAVQMLRSGSLVAFPTDTVYGVGADVFSFEAVEKLFTVKGRDTTKAIAVLLGDVTQLPLVSSRLTQAAIRLGERFWPGALTLVVERNPRLPDNLSPLPTVGVRIPNHPLAVALLKRSGPLAVTSANLSGGTNPLCPQDVWEQLTGRIDLIIDGGMVPGGVPSTVLDCTQPELAIIRPGPVSWDQIQAALR